MTQPAPAEKAPEAPAPAPQRVPRHYTSFSFFKIENDFRRLSKPKRDSAIRELLKLLDRWSQKIQLHAYSTAGTRPDSDFMLWRISPRIEDIHDMSVELQKTALGAYLQTPYSYLAMTRKSMYVDKHRHPGQEGTRLQLEPGESKFLFVYPFVKTHGWYQLPMEERQKMMNEHIESGHKFPTVKLNTTYSYGLDDQEFVVAFESDYPDDFLDLVMALRTGKARPYTEKDTPIFTCVKKSFKDLCRIL